MADSDRRGFLKVATCAVGGGLGLVIAAPVVRLVAAPAGLQTVTTPKEPIDVGALERIAVGAPWQKLDVVAPVVSDAWTTAHDVVLGAAWVRRPSAEKVVALSAICPHLGCAVGWDPAAKTFLCPCHNSKWDEAGALVPHTGPAKRGLDPLIVQVKDGRLRLQWQTFQLDSADSVPA